MLKQNDYNIEDINFLKKFLFLTDTEKQAIINAVKDSIPPQPSIDMDSLKENLKSDILSEISLSLSDSEKENLKNEILASLTIPSYYLANATLSGSTLISHSFTESALQASGQNYAWQSPIADDKRISDATSWSIPALTGIKLKIKLFETIFDRNSYPVSVSLFKDSGALTKELSINLYTRNGRMTGWNDTIDIDVINFSDHLVTLTATNIILLTFFTD